MFKQKNKGQKGLNDPSVLWINYLAVLSTMGCCLSLGKYSCFLWSNKKCLKNILASTYYSLVENFVENFVVHFVEHFFYYFIEHFLKILSSLLS